MSFWLTNLLGAPLVALLSDQWQGFRSGVVIAYLLTAVVVLTALLNYIIINSKIKIDD